MSQHTMKAPYLFYRFAFIGCLAALLFHSPTLHAAKVKTNPSVKVTSVLPTELFYTGKANDLLWRDTCEGWTLSPKQIEQFFKLSDEYQNEDGYVEYAKTFEWAHCSIIGKLKSDNSEWNFEINASGAAEWRNESGVRAWGCSDSACKTLLIPEQDMPKIPAKPPVRILQIGPAEYDKRYDLVESTEDVEATFCQSWGLTAEQAERFFSLSDEYLEGHFRLFYWLPCNVNGVLESEGRKWNFSINQAASGIWRDGDTIKLWGCSADECKSLNLMMPDDSAEVIDDK
jgi:Uri superfamily endonuclease